MNDAVALLLRVFATALFDWALALACGWLLAAEWLRREPALPIPLRALRWAAALMAVALAAQFYLVVGVMIGVFGLSDVLGSASLVAGTHTGAVTLCTLAAVCLLFLVSLLPRADNKINRITTLALTVLILALHATIGHAANDGNFSLAELLQFLHLSAMALWTGGVLISALVVLPRLPTPPVPSYHTYVNNLSNVSAWSVAMVLLTGAWKGWTGLDQHLGGLVHTGWGRILLAKLVFVGIALGLGLLHRIQIAQRRQDEREPAWTTAQTSTFLATLRVEALCLTLVLLLSAWLGSVDPAGM